MGLLLAVHFEAKRLGLKGLAPENIPNAVEVLKNQGHLVIPLVVLIGMIVLGYTPLYAAVFSIFATILASWLRKETRMSFKDIVDAAVEMCIRDRFQSELIIMDEPTTALNNQEIENLFTIMRRLKGQGVSSVSYTHLDVYKRQVWERSSWRK